jgi:formate transporter
VTLDSYEGPVPRRSPLDALLPPEMARRAEEIGAAKVAMDRGRLLALAVLAGAFIAFGGNLLDRGGGRRSGRAVGRDACAGRNRLQRRADTGRRGRRRAVHREQPDRHGLGGRASTWALLRNWILVYIGNFAGGVGIALLASGARLHEAGSGAFGASALGIAVAKLQLGFVQAVLLGVLCNVLVCLAVWLAYSARSTTDRVLAIVPPIAAFVGAGSSTPSPTCTSCRSRCW